MNIKDCIRFANEHPICYLATSEEGQPHVRALGIWFVDETGFYFQTASMKDLPHQLEKNPKTEVCFYQHGGVTGTMLRITGEVEFIYENELKERALKDRPFLKSMGLNANSPELILFKITHGKAHIWTMENNLKPKEWILF